MAPIPFAIIGTNWITHDYVTHAHATGKWKLVAVYSRKEQTAHEFASRYNTSGAISLHTSLDDLASNPHVQAVYIASPNILHYEHAKQMLNAGKHVVVEKPATSTIAQLTELYEIAYTKKVILVEAYRHIQEVNFKILKKNLEKVGTILGGTLSYCQFSSRYDAVLRGETPNVFSLDFGGGALTDLGVYTVAAAVELFGEPRSSIYHPVIMRTGADGAGTLILKYDTFSVTLSFSKMFYSAAPSEIYGEKGTLEIPSITDITRVSFWDPRKKEKVELGVEKEKLNLKEEAEEHGRMILEGDVECMRRREAHSKAVVRVTESVRKQNGLLFPGERAE
jgi:predicted dehydrogenase